jgi:hypothetical protein
MLGICTASNEGGAPETIERTRKDRKTGKKKTGRNKKGRNKKEINLEKKGYKEDWKTGERKQRRKEGKKKVS